MWFVKPGLPFIGCIIPFNQSYGNNCRPLNIANMYWRNTGGICGDVLEDWDHFGVEAVRIERAASLSSVGVLGERMLVAWQR